MRHVMLSSQDRTAINGADVWAALNDEGKALPAATPNKLALDVSFDSTALLHNLRPVDWGRPLSEIRDDFWKAPRLPLLAGGENDLREAVFSAVTENKMRIVDENDEERSVGSVSDVNLASNVLRIAKPVPSSDDTTSDRDHISSRRAGDRPKTGDRHSADQPHAASSYTRTAPASHSPEHGSAPTGPAHDQEPGKHLRATIITRFEVPTDRDNVSDLLSVLASIVDEAAEYAHLHIELVGPARRMEDLASAVENTGTTPTVAEI